MRLRAVSPADPPSSPSAAAASLPPKFHHISIDISVPRLPISTPLPMKAQVSSTTSLSLPFADSSTSPASPTPAPLYPNQSNSPTSSYPGSRCEGLDLLVEAILHVAGPVVFDPPLSRRRVFRRARRAFGLEGRAADGFGKNGVEEVGIEVFTKPKRRKRIMALPLKYQDSVLQPWRRSTRPRRPKSDKFQC